MATVDGKKTGGRKPGTPNKMPHALRADLGDKLAELGFDPIVQLVKVHKAAWVEYERADVIHAAINANRAHHDMAPLNASEATSYLKIAESSSAEILQYLLPKLKSQEFKGEGVDKLVGSFTELMKQVAAGATK